MTEPATLTELLARYDDELIRFVRRAGSGLLRYESEEDLRQGVHQRAIEAAAAFECRGDAEFLAWLRALARAHVVDRHHYWTALKRQRGPLLRLTWNGGADRGSTAAGVPAADGGGPFTRASMREQMTLAVKVLGALPPRDRQLVRWASQGVALAEQADRLGVSYDAAQRAGRRAIERYRKTFLLVAHHGDARVSRGPRRRPDEGDQGPTG